MKKIFAKLLLVALSFAGLWGCSGQDNLPQNKEISAHPYEALASSYQEITNFGENPGKLKVFLYAPSDVRPFAPVIFVLHGCGGSAAWMRQYTGFDKVAETEKAYVAYVEKTGTLQNCFAWSTDAGRRADTSSIAQLAAHLKTIRSIDESQVYIAGLSAGGAMANAALALYPQLFKAGAIVAGLPYGASSQSSIPELPAIDCQGTCPRVMVYQGTDDKLVSVLNAQKIIEQWAAAHGISSMPVSIGTLNDSDRHEYKSYQNQDKKELLSLVMLKGFGHAWPVDPNGTGPKADAGGAVDSQGYAVDEDLNAAFYSYEFFKAGRIIGDTIPPEISLMEVRPICPDSLEPDCAVIPEMRYYQVKASDNKALKQIEILVNGTLHKTVLINGAPAYQGNFEINISRILGTSITVTARVTDMASLSAEASIDYGFAAPKIKFVEPVEGKLCLQADRALDKVEFYINNSLRQVSTTSPYCLELTQISAPAQIKATAVSGSWSGSLIYDYEPVAFPCSQWDATVYEHVQAGRAETYTKWYMTYAKLIGSGEELGQVGNAWFSTKKLVKEEQAGFFQLGACESTNPVGEEPKDFISVGDASEGIAFDGKGNLFVTSYNNGQILKYGASKEKEIFVNNVSGPSALSFDPDGNLWVALNAGKAVHKYDANGVLQKAFTGTGALFGGGFQGPNGLRVSKKGIVYFTDNTAKKVYRIKNNEVKLMYTETSFSKGPNGVVLNEQEDTLFVLATEMTGFGKLGSITAVSLDGDGEYVSKKVLALSLSMPVLDGGVFGRDGLLYVTYNKKDIARVNVETGAVEVIYVSKGIGDKLCWPAEIAFGKGEGFNPDLLYITQIGTAAALGEKVTEGNQTLKTLKIF